MAGLPQGAQEGINPEKIGLNSSSNVHMQQTFKAMDIRNQHGQAPHTEELWMVNNERGIEGLHRLRRARLRHPLNTDAWLVLTRGED
jgi:hypothetical protein